MAKNKVVNISDARKAHDYTSEYENLMSIMEHLRDMVSERMIVLSNMQDAAREAAEEANLDFSKFRLNGGTAGVYFYGLVTKLSGDQDLKTMKQEGFDAEEIEMMKNMRDNMILIWSFESKNGKRYDINVQYSESEDDPNGYDLTWSLIAFNKGEDKPTLEYNFVLNAWEDFKYEEEDEYNTED